MSQYIDINFYLGIRFILFAYLLECLFTVGLLCYVIYFILFLIYYFGELGKEPCGRHSADGDKMEVPCPY
jgi:hypothetical protein